MHAPEIVKLNHDSDLSSPLRLMEEIFGPREGHLAALRKWTQDANRSVLTAWCAGEAIAISTALITDVPDYEKFGEAAKRFFENHRVGNFQILAVRAKFRRQRLAYELSQRQYAWMQLEKCTAAAGVSWNHGSADTSEHLFKTAGFRHLGQVADFYLEESRNKAHRCPVCKSECRCAASLYGIHLLNPSQSSKD